MAGAVRPVQLSTHVEVDVDWSNVNVIDPVAGLEFGGFSLTPIRVALQVINDGGAA